MLEEALVLDRQDSVDQMAGESGDRDRPVRTVSEIAEVAEAFGLERDVQERCAAVRVNDRANVIARDVEADPRGRAFGTGIAARTEKDVPGIGPAPELARDFRRACDLVIAEPRERAGEIRGGEGHPRRKRTARRIDDGRCRKAPEVGARCRSPCPRRHQDDRHDQHASRPGDDETLSLPQDGYCIADAVGNGA